MEYFGIVKFRRTRQVFSKSKNAYVAIHDYVIQALNSDSNQGYPYSANEEKNKTLKEQGMRDGALGTMCFFTEARPYTGKDGIEQDFAVVYPTKFRPYQSQTAQQNAQPKTTDFTEGNNPPF